MKKAVFDSFVAVAGGLAAFLFGDLGGIFYALIAITILDYLTGILNAIIMKKISSKIGFIGILKKVVMFIIVAVANIIDVYAIGASGVLRTTVIFFFIANEGISILENAAKSGIPIPAKLLDILEQLKAKQEPKGELASPGGLTKAKSEKEKTENED